MKTIITLSTALLLSFVAPAYASSDPGPLSKKDRNEMMTKKKKNKKNKKGFRLFHRDRDSKTCAGMVN